MQCSQTRAIYYTLGGRDDQQHHCRSQHLDHGWCALHSGTVGTGSLPCACMGGMGIYKGELGALGVHYDIV